jgi:hypothetical protein
MNNLSTLILGVCGCFLLGCTTPPFPQPPNDGPQTPSTTTTTTTTSTSTSSTTGGQSVSWIDIQWDGGPDQERQARALIEGAEAFGYGDDPRLLKFVLSNEHVNGDRDGGRMGWVCDDCSCYAWNRDDGNQHHLTHYCLKPSANPNTSKAPYETVKHEQFHSVDDMIPASDKRLGNGNRGHEQFMRHKITREWLEVGPEIAVRWPLGVRRPTWKNWSPILFKGKAPEGWKCGSVE